MIPIENIQEFRWDCAWNVSFCAQLACWLTKWPDQGMTGWTRGHQTEWSFSMMQDFRQSSEAVNLSQVSKMLRQLAGQISAHYSPSKIRNTHLRLFCPDQGPHNCIQICSDRGCFDIMFPCICCGSILSLVQMSFSFVSNSLSSITIPKNKGEKNLNQG